jgi:lipoprotein-anchoring transpeptidase ErfK/SrfK
VQTSISAIKIPTQQKLTSEITENKIIAKDINTTISKLLLVSANIIDKVTVDKKKNNDLNTTLNFNEINSSNTLVSKSKTCIQSPFIGLLNPKQFEQIILEINSTTHQLQVYGVNKSNHNLLKTFIVSTARKNTKMPMGEGSISAISINPIWYPTEQTIKHFRDKKGIDLPTSVLPGNPLNYMGMAKINLTHIVDGKNTYRIHGTINEKTIGTHESSGCIRMKNKEVLELANFLKIFTKLKGFHNVHVFIM